MLEIRPVHEQLLDLCQRELAAGKWAMGERFPSERELSAEHGISRATANKVLSKLASGGWIELRKGLGAFVAERPTLFASLRHMESFTSFAAEQGFHPETEVVAFVRGGAPAPPAVRLERSEGPWIYVERLRKADGEVVIFERRWLPRPRFPRLRASMLAGSFYALCGERYGWSADRQEVVLRAVLPPSREDLNWRVPALCLRGSAADAKGLLWIEDLYYRGDRFSLSHDQDLSAGAARLGMRLTECNIPNPGTSNE